MTKEDAFIDSMVQTGLQPHHVRGIISSLRTLGYITEQDYSLMNTALSSRSPTVRSDGSETIELARNRDKMLPREY